jgi:quercetin dioxygenase-like cupin family protein
MTNENGDGSPTVVDLPRLVALARGQRVAWSAASADLNVNLIVLQQGESIQPHRNDEVDVLVVGIDGSGELLIDGKRLRLTPDTAILIPRGAERGATALQAPFAYLTCHRRRGHLWPARAERDG